MIILSLQDTINNWFTSIGMDGAFGTTFIVVSIMIAFTLIALLYNAPLPIVILLNVILLIIATLLAIIPAWVVVGVLMILMILSYIVITDIPVGGKKE